MSVASTGGRRGRPSRPGRFSFWVDRAGTPRTGSPTLLRYDLRGRGVRRGARLGVDGRWHASTQPDALLWLHTGSGDPVDIDEAREVARQLGFPDLDVTDPVVLP